MNKTTTILISIGILLLGAAVTAFIFSSEPTAERSGATRETAMLVDVIDVQEGRFRPEIQVMGTVTPSQDITLSPQVSGEVVRLAPRFAPGSQVRKGQTLLQIDPSDYRHILRQRESELRQAISDSVIEMGRQDVARQDYRLLGDTMSGANESLVLRRPQLDAVRSRIESARAAVEQAELDLKRTTITAPFDAHVLSRDVNVGSLVSPGDLLGRLVGIDTYWIEATVPVAQLQQLSFPPTGAPGSPVTVRHQTAWRDGVHRTGYLYKLVGALENQTRMARVLIVVPDPLSLRAEHAGLPPLIIGSFLEVTIEGQPLDSVIRLSRDYVREDGTVWVMDDGKLSIRDVHIRFKDAKWVYISSGLDPTDKVITSDLATVVDGAPLRLDGASPESQSGGQQ